MSLASRSTSREQRSRGPNRVLVRKCVDFYDFTLTRRVIRDFREFSGSQSSACELWPALQVTQERPVRDFAASMPRRFIALVVIPMDAFET